MELARIIKKIWQEKNDYILAASFMLSSKITDCLSTSLTLPKYPYRVEEGTKLTSELINYLGLNSGLALKNIIILTPILSLTYILNQLPHNQNPEMKIKSGNLVLYSLGIASYYTTFHNLSLYFQ